MRLYRIGALWRGTESDAKTAAKESGLGWRKVEVPTDKAGLLNFLEQLLASESGAAPMAGIPAVPSPTPRPGTCPACNRSESAAARAAENEDLAAITGFIFDRATPIQVENIFAALGTRFHELRKVAEATR